MENGTDTPGFEHSVLKGVTLKNMIVTIVCTASIVVSVMSTYFNLKSDIQNNNAAQNTRNQITDLRLKVLEDQIIVIQHQIDEIKADKK